MLTVYDCCIRVLFCVNALLESIDLYNVLLMGGALQFAPNVELDPTTTTIYMLSKLSS